MSRKYRFNNPEAFYFVSVTTVDWVDVFIRPEYQEVLIESLRYCQQHKGLQIGAWCLMPSHLHLIIGSETQPLPDILRDFKRHTSSEMRKNITQHPQESRREWMLARFVFAGRRNSNNKNDWQFWQQHNHPQEILSLSMLQQKLDYLHQNPVVAGLVEEPQDYALSSARDYATGKCFRLPLHWLE